jgi:diguanylate cyclase (GGDEF)-like protein/PAS domain S-box-containing protein
MVRSRFLRDASAVAVFGAVYFVTGKLGLKLALVHTSATAVWPCTGIALAAILFVGYRLWPGIWLGAFALNLMTAGSVITSISIATGNTLEGVLGAYLVNRYAHGRNALGRVQDAFKFSLLAGMLSTAVSATFGVTALALGGFAPWANYGPIWFTWWLGDAASAVVVTPLLILWILDHHIRWNWVRFSEFASLMVGMFLVGQIVFGGLLLSPVTHYPLEYLEIPFLIWAAFRYGGRETALAIFLLSGISIWGTLHGFGPFVTSSPNNSLLMLQLFMVIFALMGLILAAAVAERKRVAERFVIAVESAPNAMVMVDQRGRIALVNSQAVKMFGYNREELNGQSVEVLIPERFRDRHPQHRIEFSSSPQARAMGEGRDLYAVRKDGSEFPVEIGLNPIETETGLLIISAIVDITERKRAEEQIRHLALADPLTGLANHRRLLDALDSEIKRHGRTGRSFAVLLLDLDGLKKINDAHGHLVGSHALGRVANILRTHCREIDTAARYGGDEFVVVLPETESEGVRYVAQRISEHLRNDGEKPSISVSSGAAVFPQDGKSIEELLAAADRALYREKRSSKKLHSNRRISHVDE